MYTLFLLAALPGLWIVILFDRYHKFVMCFLQSGSCWNYVTSCLDLERMWLSVSFSTCYWQMQLQKLRAKLKWMNQFKVHSSERIGLLVILAARITTIRKCPWFPDQSSRQWQLHQPHVQPNFSTECSSVVLNVRNSHKKSTFVLLHIVDHFSNGCSCKCASPGMKICSFYLQMLLLCYVVIDEALEFLHPVKDLLLDAL